MARTGTQVSALTGGIQGTQQLPKPVDDVTQNYGLNGEWAGSSPWGQKLVVKLGYNGSTYTDNYSFFTVQGSGNANNALYGARDALWPSNQANAFSGTVAADLPWKSRYVGQVNYTMMRQNESFIPNNTFPADMTALPASSLNGAINTLLSFNQITTKITPELTSKLTYRYYDFQNDTPELLFGAIPPPPGPAVPNSPSRDGSAGTELVNSLSMAYVKQNAGAELNWRPTKEWNLGVAYGFERYDWTRADVDATNESNGKIYADWKPMSWATLRASGFYGVRRSDNYDYLGHVGNFQWNCPGTSCDTSELYNTTYRQLMISDRDMYKANVSADVAVVHNVTVTPFAKYVEAKYGVDPATQQGLQDSRKWSVGSDVTYLINRDTSIMVGYMYEWGSQLLFGTSCTISTYLNNPAANCSTSSGPIITRNATQTLTNDTTTVQTFTAALRYAVIPDKLDTDLRYTLSHGVDNMNLWLNGPVPGRSSVCTSAPLPCGGMQFPQDRTWFQRLDATAVYTFDKEQVAALGWKGKIKAKLHYAWERNTADNWANDPLTPYTTIANSTLWLAWNNPNYNVHMLSVSMIASW